MVKKYIFVVIPTYNEKENIKKLIQQILFINKELQLVIVDDNSPDGTWKIVSDLAKKNKRINLIVRKSHKGTGNAGKIGFKYSLNHNADIIIEMDADFSHDPKYIPQMIETLNTCDVVLGSRFVKNGKEKGRPLRRRLITILANAYIRLVLGIRVKDCNSGYRCFRREVLEKINVDKIKADGPAIVQEVLFKCHKKGFKIKEIPIIFRERQLGESSLSAKKVFKGYLTVLKLKYLDIVGRL